MAETCFSGRCAARDFSSLVQGSGRGSGSSEQARVQNVRLSHQAQLASSFSGKQLRSQASRADSLEGTSFQRKGSVVECRKGKGMYRGKPWLAPGGAGKQAGPQMPNMDDDDNPKFVLFVRSKTLPRWFPLSVVTGGTAAKWMVQAMGNEWGRKLYGGTLTRNMGSVVYKDERQMRMSVIKTFPILKDAKDLEYGYKVMDKKNPKASMSGSDVLVIPPKEELKTVLDKAKDFFSGAVSNVTESVSSIGSGAAAPAEAEKKASGEQKTS